MCFVKHAFKFGIICGFHSFANQSLLRSANITLGRGVDCHPLSHSNFSFKFDKRCITTKLSPIFQLLANRRLTASKCT